MNFRIDILPWARRLAACLLFLLAGSPAFAAFPERPITLVVPYPPGGAADTLGRILAHQLAKELPGATVVVENRAGAGTAIGAGVVARAAADGYTLLISSNTTFTLNPALKSNLPYDPLKSFESLGIVGEIPLMLIVNPKTPVNSVQELVALAKKEPGKLSYASFGYGTTAHFAGELFKSMAGVDIVHVPYNGSAGDERPARRSDPNRLRHQCGERAANRGRQDQGAGAYVDAAPPGVAERADARRSGLSRIRSHLLDLHRYAARSASAGA